MIIASVLDAVEDMLDLGAKIINFSGGNTYFVAENNALWKWVIKWKGSDALFVFATANLDPTQDEIGNDEDSSPSSLATELSNVISVTSIGYDYSKSAPVNELDGYGGNLSVAAPGNVASTTGDKAYSSAVGTSFATPLVTGLAGLIWSVNSTLTAAEVKDIIVEGSELGARKVPDPQGGDYYVIDAFESLKLAKQTLAKEIAASDIITVDGKEWAQVDLFTNLSWNDINAVCPGGACMDGGVLNDYEMTGWTWASAGDIAELFNYYIYPEPPAFVYWTDFHIWGQDFNSNFPTAAEFFSDGWRPTTNTSQWRSLMGLMVDSPDSDSYYPTEDPAISGVVDFEPNAGWDDMGLSWGFGGKDALSSDVGAWFFRNTP